MSENIPELIIFPPYKPANWYWYVGGDKTQVWSSATGEMCALDDTDFLEWKQVYLFPARISSNEELLVIMDRYAPDAAADLRTLMGE